MCVCVSGRVANVLIPNVIRQLSQCSWVRIAGPVSQRRPLHVFVCCWPAVKPAHFAVGLFSFAEEICGKRYASKSEEKPRSTEVLRSGIATGGQ